MNVITAPYTITKESKSIFCAGGITGCPDWQKELLGMLAHENLTVFNPRRPDFNVGDLGAALTQIRWEFEHLRRADAILFWFPAETLCPIVLYELGAWSMAPKKIFVGVHEKYQRRFDVETQTRLARPDVQMVYSLPALAFQIGKWVDEG